MSIQLQEIKNIFIKNRLTEGVDFKRYEWLCGDGRAYIDTKVTDLSTSDYIKTIFDDSGNIGVRIRTWGREGNRLLVGNDGSTSALIIWGATKSSTLWYNNNGIYVYDMYFDLLNNKVIINNGTYSLVLPHGNGVSFLLFARHHPNRVDFVNWAKYKSFEIHNQINLVPCQLLKPIPASLDANNIARSAGECGMYDSISGKFYGNVASTGTFTVEGEVEPETHTGLQQIYQNRMIEGVDYETYEWLKADIPINTTMMSLPINSKNFEFKRKFIQVGHSDYMYGDTFFYSSDVVNSVNYSVSVWNRKLGQNDGIFGTDPTGRTVELISTENSLSIDNISVSLRDLINYINFNAVWNSPRKCIFLTSSIKVDGVTRYVPCQLLRSIPRNLDAQCKERQAGECGMVDLISGKFYGNVASSGTFTVENDNNE